MNTEERQEFIDWFEANMKSKDGRFFDYRNWYVVIGDLSISTENTIPGYSKSDCVNLDTPFNNKEDAEEIAKYFTDKGCSEYAKKEYPNDFFVLLLRKP